MKFAPQRGNNQGANRIEACLEEARDPQPRRWLHAFRHGLATELVEAAAHLTVLQHQLRHADIKTTLKLYSHVIPQSQRDAMEQVGGFQSLLNDESLLKFVRK